MAGTSTLKSKDWAGNFQGFLLAWGLPIAALALSKPLADEAKALVWAAALVWMGAACLANARRCGRMHCYFTGPFFLVMAAASLVHGFGLVELGPEGWRWLGGTLVVGTAVLWVGPERIWGKYAGRSGTA